MDLDYMEINFHPDLNGFLDYLFNDEDCGLTANKPAEKDYFLKLVAEAKRRKLENEERLRRISGINHALTQWAKDLKIWWDELKLMKMVRSRWEEIQRQQAYKEAERKKEESLKWIQISLKPTRINPESPAFVRAGIIYRNFQNGFSTSEIAQTYGVSIGEITIAMKLYTEKQGSVLPAFLLNEPFKIKAIKSSPYPY